MRNQTFVPVPVRVTDFSTEAAVLRGTGGGNRLTSRAPPAPRLSSGGLSPLLYTIEMENLKKDKFTRNPYSIHRNAVTYLEAIVTVPSCMSLPDSVKADHALGLTADQLIGQPDPKVGSSEQGQLALVGSLK